METRPVKEAVIIGAGTMGHGIAQIMAMAGCRVVLSDLSQEFIDQGLARIRENLTFAVLYNVAAVPLAAAGLLSPFYAAIAMSASSLIVTANAVRLQSWKPRT